MAVAVSTCSQFDLCGAEKEGRHVEIHPNAGTVKENIVSAVQAPGQGIVVQCTEELPSPGGVM